MKQLLQKGTLENVIQSASEMQFMQWSNICVDSTIHSISEHQPDSSFNVPWKLLGLQPRSTSPHFPEAPRCFRDINHSSFRNDSSRGNIRISVHYPEAV